MDTPAESPKIGAADVLRQRGLRCTRQRAVVFEALRGTTQHPTAEELFADVRRDEPGISLATVYNTLDTLTQAGLARRLPAHANGGPCRYDADVSNHAHVVLDDGRVVDVPHDLSDRLLAALSPEVLAQLEAAAGVRVTGVRLTLTGQRA